MIYEILEDQSSEDEIVGGPDIPQSLEEFVDSMKGSKRLDAKTFAIKLKSMVSSSPFLFYNTHTHTNT